MAKMTTTMFKLPSGDFVWVSANWDDPDGAVLIKGPIDPVFGYYDRWEVEDFRVRDVGSPRGALARLIETLGAEGYCSPHGPFYLGAYDIANWAEIEAETEEEVEDKVEDKAE